MSRPVHDASPPPMAFVVVHDIAASWTTYAAWRRGLAAGSVPGLLLHAAGPTDEGFRTIDVWTSDAAYQRHRTVSGDPWPADLAVPPVVRTLHVREWTAPPWLAEGRPAGGFSGTPTSSGP